MTPMATGFLVITWSVIFGVAAVSLRALISAEHGKK